MKTLLRTILTGAAICSLCSLSTATQPAAPAPEKQTSYEELAALGDAVSELDDITDNVFIYEEHLAATRQAAKSLTGATVTFPVIVQRVTHDQVFVDVPDAGEARIALKHATPPEFGNLRTVDYCGPPSTFVSRHFARRVSLRIGTEIPLDTAKTLRHADVILLTGKTESVRVAETIFCPIALVVLAEWNIIEVIPNSPIAY